MSSKTQYEFENEKWRETENDDRDEEYHELQKESYNGKLETDEGIDDKDETSKIIRMTSHLF